MKRKKNLIIIAGPTAVGKTALAIDLAIKFNTEIISADSRQFYKEMNIGTAKPAPAELKAVPHHFIDSHSVAEEFSAGAFEIAALQKLDEIFSKNDVAVMAGGSGLFIKAVTEGFDALPDVPAEVREELNTIFDMEGIEKLQQLLKEKDPEYYNTVDIQNPQRIIRALEVTIATGKPFSSFRKNSVAERDFDSIKIGLTMEREQLYERINLRVDKMMDQGLLEEVRKLHKYKGVNALETVGYKELFGYLDKKITLEEAVELIKRNTRRYAKRQLTWFRKDKDFEWFEPHEKDKVLQYIHQKIQAY